MFAFGFGSVVVNRDNENQKITERERKQEELEKKLQKLSETIERRKKLDAERNN